MKVKEWIKELEKYDEELDINIYKIYNTKRIEKFDTKRIVPCKDKKTRETTKVAIII